MTPETRTRILIATIALIVILAFANATGGVWHFAETRL